MEIVIKFDSTVPIKIREALEKLWDCSGLKKQLTAFLGPSLSQRNIRIHFMMSILFLLFR